jgi:diguanylate cyclase (GGDEF)-like protein
MYGHPFGNEILRDVAQLLVEMMAPQDVISRYQGGQFAIISAGANAGDARTTADRVREAIEQNTWIRSGMPVHVTCSAGVAEFYDRNPNNDLLDPARVALIQAKTSGRNRVVAAA